VGTGVGVEVGLGVWVGVDVGGFGVEVGTGVGVEVGGLGVVVGVGGISVALPQPTHKIRSPNRQADNSFFILIPPRCFAEWLAGCQSSQPGPVAVNAPPGRHGGQHALILYPIC
jgi:hypothetical protein